MRVFALLCAACVPLSVAVPAVACSVISSYRVPTNLELTRDADLILIGRVDSAPSEFTGFGKPEMVVTPLHVLKGTVPKEKPLKLMGSIAEPRFSLKSDPTELVQAHPLSYIGGCIRYMFPKGATVLFFVSHAEKQARGDLPAEMKGTLVPAGGPFSRWAEDVPDAHAPWVRATEIYVEASALPVGQQRAFLTARREALTKAGDANSKIVAADIGRQLVGQNKTWNEQMQEEIAKPKGKE